jgi:hypothetical protein
MSTLLHSTASNPGPLPCRFDSHPPRIALNGLYPCRFGPRNVSHRDEHELQRARHTEILYRALLCAPYIVPLPRLYKPLTERGARSAMTLMQALVRSFTRLALQLMLDRLGIFIPPAATQMDVNALQALQIV